MAENTGQFKRGAAPGRPKGAKNKKKGAAAALVAAALAPVSTPDSTRSVALPVSASAEIDPRDAEIKGIDAKVLLNNVMRKSWREYVAQGIKLEALEQHLTELLADKLAGRLPAVSDEAFDAFMKQIDLTRGLVDKYQSLATQHANAVMPFEYARLQSTSHKQVGDIIVRIKEFGAGPKQAKWQKPKA